MNSQQLSTSQISSALRAVSADFFKMPLLRVASRTPAQDPKPLRRTLNNPGMFDEYIGNENMCQALWQLMERC